jgi:hypothetical protein
MASGADHRRRLRGLLLAAVGLLYLISVPWYRAADAAPPLWLGLPQWVTVAVVCYLAAACLNALAWWIAPVSDELGGVGACDERSVGRDGAAAGPDRTDGRAS